MNTIKAILLIGALALPLAGCVEETGSSGGSSAGSDSLATRGNLSPDAIRLQTASQRLLSKTEEQQAAEKRMASFRAQATALGVAAGATTGYVACEIGDCNSRQRNQTMILAAIAGGAIGNQMGGAQAQRQNDAAAVENELRRRLSLAGEQLDSARSARRLSEQVAASNQRKLASLRAEVAAGRASRSQLQMAQADARADARQIKAASSAMDKGATSMQGESQLNARRTQMTAEERATEQSYDALMRSIQNSAL